MYAQPKIAGFSGMDKGKLVLPVGKAVHFPASLDAASGEVLSWRCSKPLPEGLMLDQRKGTIRGVPLTPGKSSKITVIASNSRGEASSKMSIQVRGPPPPDFGYEKQRMVLTVGALCKNRLHFIGKEVECSYFIKPDLPAGLKLDKSTGAIEGLAEVAQTCVDYTVRAKNKFGSSTTTVSIRVIDVLVINEYTDTFPKYVVGIPVPPNLPSGAKHSFERVWFTVSPPLPRGLSMAMTTGIIGGTPQVPCKLRAYRITATSRFSSTSTTITIEVMDKSKKDDLKANEEIDMIDLITSSPSPGKVHISFTGPIPKGKEWMALGRLSAPSVLPVLKMEGVGDFLGFLAAMYDV